MTDTVIKGTGNSRSIRSVPNLAALAPDFDGLLKLLTGDGLPIDLGPLNPLGVDVMGTPLDAEHIITIEQGSYRGTGGSGQVNAVSLEFSSTPKLIVIFGVSSGFEKSGVGFLAPFYSTGICLYDRSLYSGSMGKDPLVVLTEGTKVSWYYYDTSNLPHGYMQLNASGTAYYYTAFL